MISKVFFLKKIDRKILISTLISVQVVMYVIPVSMFINKKGRYPRQLSESTSLVLEGFGKDPNFFSYIIMISLVIVTLLLMDALISQVLQNREKTAANFLDYCLTLFTIIPITLELIRLFYFPDSKNFENLVFYTLVIGVFASLAAITFQTASLRSKHADNLSQTSEISHIIFSLIFFSFLLAAIINIEDIMIENVLISRLHTLFAVLSYILFYPFIYSLRSKSWYSWIFLILSTISIFGFNLTPQADSTTITPHLIYQFIGTVLLFASFLSVDLGIKKSED